MAAWNDDPPPPDERAALTRRRFLALSAAAALPAGAPAAGAAPGGAAGAGAAAPARPTLLTRPIPSSGEALPVIGLGTWQTFDVGGGAAERGPLREVLRLFFDAGARAVDSSPMYGRAESVVGDLVRGTPWARQAFVATKVWTRGREAGLAQMAESERRMGGRIDLMQVHNLLDWQAHLPSLRAWKAAKRIRYTGVTHYALSAMDELARIVREEKVDFVQLPYSLRVREAEARLLPAARDAGAAVLVMRPFAQELGATSWAQLFLKWILGHPAITAALPATSNPRHMADNLAAGVGPLPDEAMRKRIASSLGV
jgi:aryl-alcohol dehydrogenase-like predicted oxidoreductase